VINTREPVLPTTTITIPNVSILGIQAMNFSISHMEILVVIKQHGHNLLH
jgi:hypothetical protein